MPKIEIYHQNFAGFEYTLKNLHQQEGLIYSISNRSPLTSHPLLELFIESYLPNMRKEKQNLLFMIMADLQSNSVSETTFKNIVRLFSIYKNEGIPAQKHWDKIINCIPNHELLLNGHITDWINQSLELLMSWGSIAPDIQISGMNNFVIEKQRPELSQKIFHRIVEQKERLQAYLSWPQYIKTIEDQERFSEKASSQWKQGHAFHFQILIDGDFAGAISIHSINYRERCFEFGYWIDQTFEGKGLITQALRLLIHCMQDKGWHKAKIKTSQDNVKSQYVAERLEMKVEITSDQFKTYSLGL